MSDSVTNYNYVGDTKVSVSIKKTNENKCTLTYDHPNGFTYLQLGKIFINLFLFKYMAF